MINIKKYNEYISESEDFVGNDTPESYIKSKLLSLKSKIEKMFSDNSIPTTTIDSVNSPGFKDKIKKSDDSLTFEDLGLSLESSEMSKGSKTHKTLTIKFSDEVNYYVILFRINLRQVTDDPEEEKSTDLIKKCFMKFKKYKTDGFELIGDISKNINIDDISEDFIVSLKIELDNEFNDENDGDGLDIEFEE